MDLVWICLLLPLAGLLINACLGWLLPKQAHGIIATVLLFASFFTACFVVASLLGLPAAQQHQNLVLYNWVVLADFKAEMGVWLDPLSGVMLLIVTGVGALIHLYAIGYMAEETEGQRRFFAYLNLFVVAMLILVLANNFMLLLVGWGGVGFASFALISHYYYRDVAAAAGVKAFVMNTLGDIGMMLGIFLLWVNLKAVDYATVFTQAPTLSQGTVTAATLLLLIAALVKSGQIPLHTWLPDAMAGPTPVSALIHAATMVTAGVYLLVRAWPLYELAPTTLTVITGLGTATMVVGALIGVVQTNIKRVLAYSTISQIGYMFLAAGVGAYSAAIFHLLTHAFFKALLFLAAGAVIHAIGGEEDLRQMGGLRGKMKLAWAAYAVGGLAIAGIPPFSGFFSKDEIIYSAFFSERGNLALGLLALFTGGLTAFYIFRSFFLTFYGENRQENPPHHLHLPGLTMAIPLIVLSILATVSGWLQIPGLTNAFEHFLAPVFHTPTTLHEVVPTPGSNYWLLAVVAALCGIIGIAAAYFLYVVRPAQAAALATTFRPLHQALTQRLYFDALYDWLLVRPVQAFSRFLNRRLERGIDLLVNGTGYLVREASVTMREVQTGYVRNYALLILGGAILLVAYVLFGWT